MRAVNYVDTYNGTPCSPNGLLICLSVEKSHPGQLIELEAEPRDRGSLLLHGLGEYQPHAVRASRNKETPDVVRVTLSARSGYLRCRHLQKLS